METKEIKQLVLKRVPPGDQWTDANKELKESMHEALPVLRGEKWVLVNWVRVNKYTK